MRPQTTREKNPYHRDIRDRRWGADWENREGDELGYQKTYGEYGSDQRGWVDEPHPTKHVRHGHAGVAPRRFKRSDEMILDHVAEALTWSPDVDARDITIAVRDGDVILSGTVPERDMIFIVDEIMESVHGIRNFDNHLKKRRFI